MLGSIRMTLHILTHLDLTLTPYPGPNWDLCLYYWRNWSTQLGKGVELLIHHLSVNLKWKQSTNPVADQVMASPYMKIFLQTSKVTSPGIPSGSANHQPFISQSRTFADQHGEVSCSKVTQQFRGKNTLSPVGVQLWTALPRAKSYQLFQLLTYWGLTLQIRLSFRNDKACPGTNACPGHVVWWSCPLSMTLCVLKEQTRTDLGPPAL